jgi:hypothetical protein
VCVCTVECCLSVYIEVITFVGNETWLERKNISVPCYSVTNSRGYINSTHILRSVQAGEWGHFFDLGHINCLPNCCLATKDVLNPGICWTFLKVNLLVSGICSDFEKQYKECPTKISDAMFLSRPS